MSFRNLHEPEQIPNHTGNRWLQAIRTIRGLKLWRVLLTLILITIFCYIMSIWSARSDFPLPDWLHFIPWASLASTGLGVIVIGFVYEWLIRNETKQELDEVLKQHFQNQARTIKNEIPGAILTTPEIMQEMLSADVVNKIIRNSLVIRLGDIQLAQEAYDSFLSHLLNHEERRRNYRCNIYLTNAQSSDMSATAAQKYYEGYIDVRYDTILQKDSLRFICVETTEEYEELLKDPNWELRWTAEPTKDFPKELAFKVESVHVSGLALNIRIEDADRKHVIVADHLDLQTLKGKPVTVYYRYKVKIKKRGHLLMVHMPCPTHNVVIELDYAHTDIYFVNVLDSFVSKTKPNIRYIPSLQKHHKIEIEVNDWVFPKDGVVFVWVLRAERHPGFWQLSIDPQATKPLPLLTSEKKDDPLEPSS